MAGVWLGLEKDYTGHKYSLTLDSTPFRGRKSCLRAILPPSRPQFRRFSLTPALEGLQEETREHAVKGTLYILAEEYDRSSKKSKVHLVSLHGEMFAVHLNN